MTDGRSAMDIARAEWPLRVALLGEDDASGPGLKSDIVRFIAWKAMLTRAVWSVMRPERAQVLRSIVGWLAMAAATPFGSLAIWLWLESRSTGQCAGLRDVPGGITFAMQIELLTDLTTALPTMMSLMAPSEAWCPLLPLLAPIPGLVLLIRSSKHRAAGWALCALGFAIVSIASVLAVAIWC